MPKIIWKIKELQTYVSQLESKVPPDYELGDLSDLHKELYDLIYKYWENFHPLIQDYIISCARIIDKASLKIQNLEDALNEKSIIFDKLKANVEARLRELNSKLAQRDQIIQELVEKTEGTTGVGMGEYQKRIDELEKTQEEVGEEFQIQIMEMDAQLDAKDATIDRLKDEIAEKGKLIEELRGKAYSFESELQALKEML